FFLFLLTVLFQSLPFNRFMITAQALPLFAVLLREAGRLSDTPAGQNNPLVRSSASGGPAAF
ncbi:hypothetical protein, partial [Klebsiella quasipneumoniae]|uniref:hypothetical protein n=1 Tax=Klebsiella quasipneumoniae TaxID=1463165 RepID=UPI0019402D76